MYQKMLQKDIITYQKMLQKDMITYQKMLQNDSDYVWKISCTI